MWRSVIVLSFLALTACQSDTAVQPFTVTGQDEAGIESRTSGAPASSPAEEIAGEWSLIAIDNNPLSSGGRPTLVFESDGRCWGSTGVNRFNSFADFEKLANGWLSLGPAAVTRMAGLPEAMALENLFLGKLESVSSFKIEGDTLRLYAGEAEAATFERVYR